MKSVILGWAIGLSLLTGISTTLLAADAKPYFGPCADDITKFCKGIKAGGGRIDACLSKHESSLSSACETGREQRRSHNQGLASKIATSCKSDLAKYCPGLKPGDGTRLACLKKNVSKISDDCKKIVQP